jgi:hypothetical protein
LLVVAAHRDALHSELLAENAVSGNLSCKSGQHTDQRDIAADARSFDRLLKGSGPADLNHEIDAPNCLKVLLLLAMRSTCTASLLRIRLGRL